MKAYLGTVSCPKCQQVMEFVSQKLMRCGGRSNCELEGKIFERPFVNLKMVFDEASLDKED